MGLAFKGSLAPTARSRGHLSAGEASTAKMLGLQDFYANLGAVATATRVSEEALEESESAEGVWAWLQAGSVLIEKTTARNMKRVNAVARRRTAV